MSDLVVIEGPVMELSIAGLVPHPQNPRQDWDEGEFEELRRSIAENGVTNMPVVRPYKHDTYQIISGHRRVGACQELGMTSLMCVVRECDDEEALILLMTENMHRADLNAIEEGEGFLLLCERLKMTEQELATKLGCTETRVRIKQELLRLPEASQDAVKQGRMELGVAQLLLELPQAVFGDGVELVQDKLDLDEALTVTQARDMIQYQLMEPYERELAWSAKHDEMRQRAYKRLKQEARMELDDPLIKVGAWDDSFRSQHREALFPVPLAERGDDAPEGVLWLHVAQRHNVPVMVVPNANGADETLAVDAGVLMESENAIYEGVLRGQEMLAQNADPTRDDLSPAMTAEAKTLKALSVWMRVKGGNKQEQAPAEETPVEQVSETVEPDLEESAEYAAGWERAKEGWALSDNPLLNDEVDASQDWARGWQDYWVSQGGVPDTATSDSEEISKEELERGEYEVALPTLEERIDIIREQSEYLGDWLTGAEVEGKFYHYPTLRALVETRGKFWN